MRLLVHALLFILLMRQALAGICSSSTLVPFSGYKVTRRHKIRLRPLQSDSYLVLTMCHRGLPVFSRTVATSMSLSEFAVPFTIEDTELDFLDRWRRRKKSELASSDGLSTASSDSESNKHTSLSRTLAIRAWIRSLGRKGEPQLGETGGSIQTNAVKVKAPEKKPRNRGSRMTGPSRRWRNRPIPAPVPCLKLARRKRYARLDVVIFIPATFVGVLFTCSSGNTVLDESDIQKQHSDAQPLAKRLSTSSLSSIHMAHKRDTSTQTHYPAHNLPTHPTRGATHGHLPGPAHTFAMAISAEDDFTQPEIAMPSETQFLGAPICPLVADDYSAHWLSVQFRPPALIYHIPYLRSPSIWDPRFQSAEIDLPEWGENVDINEAYIYSEADLAGISETLMASTRYVQQLFEAKRTKIADILAIKVRWLKKCDPRVRLSLFFFSIGKFRAIRHVVKLQRLWDTLFVNKAIEA